MRKKWMALALVLALTLSWCAVSALAEETPVGRLGTPSDVAAAALFLASPQARFITGQVLGVTGGF